MLRSWQRNLLTWLMAAVFAVPAFMGQGLHELFGLQHGACCGHESSHFPAQSAPGAVQSCHDCPVCDYLALSVDTGPVAPRLEAEAAVWAMPDAGVCQPCPASFWAFSARGPPQG